MMAYGNYRAAEKLYKEALKDSKDPYVVWKALGTLYLKLERFNDAKEAITQAVTLRPDYSQGWSQLSTIYMKEGNMAAARDAFNKANQPH